MYGYVRDKSGVKPKIGQVLKSDNTLNRSDEETAETLNIFFQSVFTSECYTTENLTAGVNDNQLSDICITENEVFEVLSFLKANKAPGPDNLHSQVLRNCAEVLAKPLFLLFTQSISTGMLPGDWRRANITPILKKGSKVNPENYRSVSLTSQAIKILDTSIRTKIMKFLDDSEIITKCQHGFIKKKSCFTNLLTTLEDWTSTVDQGYTVDIAYLDFSKAFDSVPHPRLLQKLTSYGLCGKVLLMA